MPINLPTYEQQQQAITLLQDIGVDIDTLLAGRVVKSVQSGTATILNAKTAGVNISAVDRNKAFVIITQEGKLDDPTTGTTAAYNQLVRARLISDALISLNVRIQVTAALVVDWQVIEFY